MAHMSLKKFIPLTYKARHTFFSRPELVRHLTSVIEHAERAWLVWLVIYICVGKCNG